MRDKEDIRKSDTDVDQNQQTVPEEEREAETDPTVHDADVPNAPDKERRAPETVGHDQLATETDDDETTTETAEHDRPATEELSEDEADESRR